MLFVLGHLNYWKRHRGGPFVKTNFQGLQMQPCDERLQCLQLGQEPDFAERPVLVKANIAQHRPDFVSMNVCFW